MGLGGHIMWTAVIRNLHEQTGKKVFVCKTPRFSDLLEGRLYECSANYSDDIILKNNPRLSHSPLREKNSWEEWLDDLFGNLLNRPVIRKQYEKLVFGLSRLSGKVYAHLDMGLHHYVERELENCYVWKSGGHIVDIVLRNYGMRAREKSGEFYFTPDELEQARRVRSEFNIPDHFVAVEPHTKEDYFNFLRAWPWERWEEFAAGWASDSRLNLPLVQFGEGGKKVLPGALDLSGKTDFRIAACILREAALFVGTEGGLMHAARAVACPGVIVWGGLTLPEFAGYPEFHRIIHSGAACAPCGRKGQCTEGHCCMSEIGAEEVLSACRDSLDAYSCS